MSILAEYKETNDGRHVLEFYCPGCKFYHAYVISRKDSGPVWTWNGDMEKPTFSPSLLVNGSTDKRCHLYVRNGCIEYLSDCWHELRGKTVNMETIE